MEITIPDAPFQIKTTERGALLLMENNYVYTKHRTINDKVHWQQCSEKNALFWTFLPFSIDWPTHN